MKRQGSFGISFETGYFSHYFLPDWVILDIISSFKTKKCGTIDYNQFDSPSEKAGGWPSSAWSSSNGKCPDSRRASPPRRRRAASGFGSSPPVCELCRPQPFAHFPVRSTLSFMSTLVIIKYNSFRIVPFFHSEKTAVASDMLDWMVLLKKLKDCSHATVVGMIVNIRTKNRQMLL